MKDSKFEVGDRVAVLINGRLSHFGRVKRTSKTLLWLDDGSDWRADGGRRAKDRGLWGNVRRVVKRTAEHDSETSRERLRRDVARRYKVAASEHFENCSNAKLKRMLDAMTGDE